MKLLGRKVDKVTMVCWLEIAKCPVISFGEFIRFESLFVHIFQYIFMYICMHTSVLLLT